MEVGAAKGELGKAYETAFRARHKEGFKSAFNGYGYDAVRMLAAALTQAKGSSSADVQRGLTEVGAGGFVGVTGPIAFDAEGQRIDQPYDKLRYQGGRLVPRHAPRQAR